MRIEHQEYYDWATPASDGQFEGKLSKYATLDIAVTDENDLDFALRRKTKTKTDFFFTITEMEAKELYKMLHEKFGEDP